MILVAYDGSPDAEAAIETAAELLPGEPTTVLTVWERFVDMLTRTGAGIGITFGGVDFDEIDDEYRENARKLAAEGAQRANAAGLQAAPRSCVRENSIAGTIIAQSEEVDARAIVVGTRGLTGVKSLFLGSVSHAIVQHAGIPVVVAPSKELARERSAQPE